MRKIAAVCISVLGALVLSASAGAVAPTDAGHGAKTSCDVAGLAAKALAELDDRASELPSPGRLADR